MENYFQCSSPTLGERAVSPAPEYLFANQALLPVYTDWLSAFGRGSDKLCDEH